MLLRTKKHDALMKAYLRKIHTERVIYQQHARAQLEKESRDYAIDKLCYDMFCDIDRDIIAELVAIQSEQIARAYLFKERGDYLEHAFLN